MVLENSSFHLKKELIRFIYFGGVNFEDESVNSVITKSIQVTVKKAPAKFKAKKLVAKQKSEKTFNVKLKNTKTKKTNSQSKSKHQSIHR